MAFLISALLTPTLMAQTSGQLNGTAILQHLNAVISWYRAASAGVESSGQPSDAIYHDNARSLALETTQLAFQSAKAEAALIAADNSSNAANQATSTPIGQPDYTKMEANITTRIDTIQSQLDAVNKQITTAPKRNLPTLASQRDRLQGELGLYKTMLDAVQKMSTFVGSSGEGGSAGLLGSITDLEKSIPELASTSKGQNPVVNSSSQPGIKPSPAGLIGQTELLYSQIMSMHSIDQLVSQTMKLRNTVSNLRQPLIAQLKDTIQQGQERANQPPSTTPAQLDAEKKAFDDLTERSKRLTKATLPLSQEIILIDQSRSNLLEWRQSISAEYKTVLRAVLARVLVIGIALALLMIFSEVWRRMTFRYVSDPRRRRQFLTMRRFVTGFLVLIVLVLGFASEFSSLATFAGFITAGIAVALQAVILSVAAYFFVVGRYGINVGDRISIAGVTGDVIDIGIVRMYLMELAGTNVDLYPTGRIVVFSNSVLFQATTPLFKQLPGTEYTWHEVAISMAPGTNHQAAQDKLMAAVNSVYDHYRKEIERQFGSVESRIDVRMRAPSPEGQLRFGDTGLEYVVRYPVELRNAAEMDGKVTRAVLDTIGQSPDMQSAVTGSPKIRAVIRG
ncbi:MAG TPA: mechanosensitive ion channel family protein [Candidatus Acidoferrales bacterium]